MIQAISMEANKQHFRLGPSDCVHFIFPAYWPPHHLVPFAFFICLSPNLYFPPTSFLWCYISLPIFLSDSSSASWWLLHFINLGYHLHPLLPHLLIICLSSPPYLFLASSCSILPLISLYQLPPLYSKHTDPKCHLPISLNRCCPTHEFLLHFFFR